MVSAIKWGIALYLLIGAFITWLVDYRYRVVRDSEHPAIVALYGVTCWIVAVIKTILN
jgi:hypothetical protein